MIERLLGRVEELPLGPVWLWLGATLSLSLLFFAWVAMLGPADEIWGAEGPPHLHPYTRLTLVVMAIGAFIWVMGRHAGRRDPETLARLQPLTEHSPAAFSELIQTSRAVDPARLRWSVLGTAALGLLAIPATTSDPLFFLDLDAWDARLVWGIGANLVVFGVMGRGLYLMGAERGAIARAVSAIRHIDLLDRSGLRPLAQIGLRRALVWAGGSSIASLVFLDVQVAWPVVLVLTGTLYVATRAFLSPVRAVHRRLREEKQSELPSVRERIAGVRKAALVGGPQSAVAELPGLLAYEARIEGVSEWPFDTPILLRFGALVILALGSWLGGALVERLLGAALG